MDEKGFRAWLADESQLTPKAQSDAVSRCRRVERITKHVLDEEVASEETLASLHDWLRANADNYTKSRDPYQVVSTLISATNLYRRFLQSSQSKSMSAKAGH